MPSLRPRTSVSTFSAWGIFFALVACPIAVPAADRAALGQGADTEKTFSVQVGAQSSDNIGRDQAEESGIASLAGITANIAGERSAISWSLNGNLQYFDYGQQEYDNEVVGAGVARASMWFLDDRMQWHLSNEFGQLRTDSLAAEGPGNRSNFNVIETGPTLELPLSAVTSLLLEARLADRSFDDESQVDSTLTTLQAGLVRALSPNRQIAILASRRATDYSGAQASDYEVQSSFLRFTQALPDQDAVTLEIGENRLKPDVGDENSGLYARVSASQKIGTRSRLILRAAQDFQDAGYALRDTVGTRPDQIGLTSDPMERRTVGANFSVEWDRTQLGLMAEAATERYETEGQRDRDASTFSLTWSRSLTPELRLGLRGSLRREEFASSQGNADEQQAELSLSRSLGRAFAVALSFQRWERESDIEDTLTENRMMLTLQYLPWGGTAAPPSLSL